MADSLAESPAPLRKDSRGWLIAFGIFEILLGGLSLLTATLVLVGTLVSRSLPAAQAPAGARFAPMAFGIVLYGLIAAFFFVAGIGSIQCRNWARILMLVASIAWLVFGAISALFVVFLLPRMMENPTVARPEVMHAIIVGIVLFVVFFGVVLPAVFLIFYTRKSVKATCLARDAERAGAAGPASASAVQSPGRKLPVPVIILAVWETISALSGLMVLAAPLAVTAFFGHVIRGWEAVACMLVFSALSGLAAWLIYQVRFAGWMLALIKLLFFGASSLVSFANGAMARASVQMLQGPEQARMVQFFPDFLKVMMVTAAVFGVAYLALLIYCRKFFVAPSPVAAA